MTKRNVRSKISPLLFRSLTFLILSHLSVCLVVSRVRAYLSTNQQECYQYEAANKIDDIVKLSIVSLGSAAMNGARTR